MVAWLVTEDQDGRGGSLEADRRARDYTRRFSVFMTSNLDGAKTAMNALGVPRLWTPYASGNDLDAGSWCQHVDAQPTDSPYVWKVVAKYSSRIERPDLNQPAAQSPELKLPKVTRHTTRISTPFDVDVNGIAVRNSAKYPYDPPADRDEKVLVMKIVRNQLAYNGVFAHDFQDSLNDRPFYGFKKGAVKCSEISEESAFENGVAYHVVTYQFELRRERIPPNARLASDADPSAFTNQRFPADESQAWTRFLLDRGFVDKNGKPCVDRYGVLLTTPGLLDGNGLQLAFDGTPVYRGHKEFPFRDFRQLNLGG